MLSNTQKKQFSLSELRIIGLSLAVLSLGIGLAYFGLFWLLEQKEERTREQKSATSSGQLK